MQSFIELQEITGDLTNTVIQKTGTGHHYLYRYEGNDIKCSVGKIAPGIDVRCENGYIVAAPSVHPDTETPYALIGCAQLTADSLADAPKALLDIIRKTDTEKTGAAIPLSAAAPTSPPPNYANAALAKECNAVRGAQCDHQEETLNNAAYAVGQLVGGGFLDYQEAVAALIDAGMAMVNCDVRRPWTRAEVSKKVAASIGAGMNSPRRNVPDAGEDHELRQLVAELNETHAVVMMGGKCLVLNETKSSSSDFPSYTFSSFLDFKNKYCTKTVKVGNTNKKLGQAWLEHPNRRSYDQVIFDPARRSNSAYNLYQGFAVSPTRGSCTLYLNHIRDIIASGNAEHYEYILNFMADAVQNPTVRPGVALVLRGGPGTGKGVFVNNFGKLFGRHFVQINDPGTLLGRFNRLLEDKLIVFADEAFWAGDKAAEGRLKGLITEPTITIEMKNVDSYTAHNYVRLIIATNEDWAVPAMSKERRFCVLDVSDARQQDRAYFAAIENEMQNGGLEALLHFLMHRSLDGIDVAKFPQTAALEDQKRLSMSYLDQWFMDCLERNYIDHRYKWGAPIPTSVAFDSFKSFCNSLGHKAYMNEASFGKALKALVPALEIKKLTVSHHGVEQHLPLNGRVNHYVLGSLEQCRKHFEKNKGIKLNTIE